MLHVPPGVGFQGSLPPGLMVLAHAGVEIGQGPSRNLRFLFPLVQNPSSGHLTCGGRRLGERVDPPRYPPLSRSRTMSRVIEPVIVDGIKDGEGSERVLAGYTRYPVTGTLNYFTSLHDGSPCPCDLFFLPCPVICLRFVLY